MESVYGRRSGGCLDSGVMPGVLHLRGVVEDGREPERFTIPEEGCRRRPRRRRRPAPHSPLPPRAHSRCRSRSPRSRRGGSITDRGTEGIAAWWKIPSAPGKVSIKRSRSVTLPSTKVTRGWSRRCSTFSRRPVARLSMMTTSWFCAKVSARLEPSRPRRWRCSA